MGREDGSPLVEVVVHGLQARSGLGLVVLPAFAAEKDRVVGLEGCFAAPERAGVGRAIAGDAVRQRCAGTDRAEALVDIDSPAGVRTGELGSVDADAPQKAREVVAAAGEQGHLRHVAFRSVSRQPGQVGRHRGVHAVGHAGHRDDASPLADLNDEREIVARRYAPDGEVTREVGLRDGDVVADRGVARVARIGPGRDLRKVSRIVRNEDDRVVDGVAPRRVVHGPAEARRTLVGAVEVDVARERSARRTRRQRPAVVDRTVPAERVASVDPGVRTSGGIHADRAVGADVLANRASAPSRGDGSAQRERDCHGDQAT